jgi:hypothetical protein
MNNKTYSAIEIAISTIGTNGSAYKSRIANMIIDELSDKDNPAANIIDAIWQATMRNAKFNQLENKKHKYAGMLYKPEIYDIAFYGFLQSIMDRICWTSRAGLIARIKNDEDEHLSGGGNGIDFSDQLSNEISMDLSSPAEIADQVNDIFTRLLCLSADIAANRNIDAEPLHMFAPSQLVDGYWVTTIQVDDWDDAISAMKDIVDSLRETPDVNEEEMFAPRKYA